MTSALVLSLLLAQAAPDAALRRFALVAGANDGGQGRVTLHFATSDARAMARVLTQLGGVAEQDLVLVEDPSAAQLARAFDQLGARLVEAQAARARTEVVFYYSGHSDEDGLLLKGDRLSYADLRARLDGLATGVRIAVLDSCASGALTRSKGGVARPSFLIDRSSQLTGHAFLTSASADEAAQESERLKASIFTHFLVSGMRGAADSSHDGKVTLGEAYQYAFAETLARTTSTRAGPQRAGYDIQLVGTGDLVLTDVRSATAHLVLDATVGGRVYVLGASGGLVVEVAKAPGKPIELGLEPGDYRVVVDEGARAVGEAQVSLKTGDTTPLSRASLGATSLEATVLRGGEAAERPWLPVDVAFVYPLAVAGLSSPAPRVNVGLGIVAERVGAVDGVLASSVVGWVDDAVRGAAAAGVLLKVGGLRGVGLSTVLVSTDDATGVEASVLNITAGLTRGVQLGAVGNLSTGGFGGLQAGTVNVATGPSFGAQLGVVNMGTAFTGGQVGVVNVGGDVSGGQVGVVNIAAHVSGAQVGVVNIAATSDAPVGILNVITRGRVRLAVWADETSVANVALKIGGEHVYSEVFAGFNPRTISGRPYFSYGLGLGVRARFGAWYGELEGTCESLSPIPGKAAVWETGILSSGLRVDVGYQLTEGVAVFVGPQLQVLVSMLRDRPPAALTPWGWDLGNAVRLVPGAAVGLQFL
jgi:Caspase domain